MLKIKPTSLFLLICLALSTGVSCADEPLTHKWIFPYIGEKSIPCFADTACHTLTLSGFDTDGDGTFFFVGGDSLNVACFKGTKEIYRKKLFLPRTGHGIIKLVGDSLHILHDQLSSVVSMCQDGKGNLSYQPLSLHNISGVRIYDGTLFNLIAVPASIKELKSFNDHRIFQYQWPNTLITDVGVHLDFDENEDIMDSLVMGNQVYTTHSKISRYTGYYSIYLGQMQSYAVYAWHTNNASAGILLIDKSGRPALKYSIPDVPPLIPLCDDGTVNGHAAFELRNSVILRNKKVFILGYDPTRFEFQVIEINLNKLLKQYLFRTI